MILLVLQNLFSRDPYAEHERSTASHKTYPNLTSPNPNDPRLFLLLGDRDNRHVVSSIRLHNGAEQKRSDAQDTVEWIDTPMRHHRAFCQIYLWERLLIFHVLLASGTLIFYSYDFIKRVSMDPNAPYKMY